jgi:transposase InsO family protein
MEKMCQSLDVSRSGYYRWRVAPKSKRSEANEKLLNKIEAKSKRSEANEKLLNKIEETYEDFQGIYGSPRITQELLDAGVECSENRVARLMRENEIAAKTKRKFKVTTNSRHNLPVAPNLVNQGFTAAAPNQLWLSDITYIWTREGWLYLAAILDVFSSRPTGIGWSMNKRMTQELVLNALKQALGRRSITSGLIFHSDRGSSGPSQHHFWADLSFRSGKPICRS